MSDRRTSETTTGLLPTADLGRDADEFLRRVRDADEPSSLVRELPPHDLLLVLREADDELRAELLALADREQVQNVIDLTCWRDDHPDLAALGELITPLAMTGLEGAGKMLDDMTDELRTLFLKRNAVVHVRENKDDDVPAAEGSELIACSDGYYFIELPHPDDVPDLDRQLLTTLLNRPFEEYQRELECIRHDLPSDLEELALRWRTGRLADQGFETRVESLELLSPLDPEQVRRAIESADDSPYPLRLDSPLPTVYSDNFGGREVLDRALHALATSDLEEYAARAQVIGAELGAMTSRLLSATGCDLGDLEAIARGVRAARDSLALGLVTVSGRDPDAGARALLTQVPAVLVRAAMGVLVPLRERARALLIDRRLALGGRPGALLDEPLSIAMRALARDLPLHWPALAGAAGVSVGHGQPGVDELEAFADPAEVRRAADLLAEAEQLAPLLRDRLGFGEVPDAKGMTGSSVLLAALTNIAGGAEPARLPLDAKRVERLARDLAEAEEHAAIGRSMAALAPYCNTAADGAVDPAEEIEPLRRLVLRLVLIGRARIRSAEPLVFLPLVS